MIYQLYIKRLGDTLIEVIFGFAILGTIIGIAFTGVINAHRSAVAAQERTQATFFAQYQAEALKNYRDSLGWEDKANGNTFLDGAALGSALPEIRTLYLDAGNPFCMQKSANKWIVIPAANCDTDSLYNPLIQDGTVNKVAIKLRRTSKPDIIQADVVVSWRNALRQPAQVVQTVTLTKER
jgi:hypothetical protein